MTLGVVVGVVEVAIADGVAAVVGADVVGDSDPLATWFVPFELYCWERRGCRRPWLVGSTGVTSVPDRSPDVL